MAKNKNAKKASRRRHRNQAAPATALTTGLDDATHRYLTAYLRDIRQLPNESAKTHRFMALVGELFSGSNAIVELSAGIEKLVRINLGGKTKRGRILEATAALTGEPTA